MKIPKIPAEFEVQSPAETVVFIAYSFSLYLLPGLLSLSIFESSSFIGFKIMAIACLSTVAGFGLFNIASTAHEGFHLTLNRNKYLSCVIGIFVSSAVIGFFGTGFSFYHWEHHKFTNKSGDPDVEEYSKYKQVLAKMFLARLSSNLKGAKYTIKKALNLSNEFSSILPFSEKQLVAFARFNIITQFVWLTGYIFLSFYSFNTALCCIYLPTFAVLLITGINPYLEHADTHIGLGQNARSRTAIFYTILQSGANFHNEHHLYPKVPCWRLFDLYKYLHGLNFYEENNIELSVGVIKPLIHVNSEYPMNNSTSFS
jgi:beta-carotene hydroxylase